MADYLLGTPKDGGQFSYLTRYPITNPYGTRSGFGTEVGIDLGLPMHTPVYALADGTVLAAQYEDCPGGVISTQCHIPLHGRFNDQTDYKLACLYYQHMDVIQPSIIPGQPVKRGELLGYSGGQQGGGFHDNQPACSSGPHIEIGINPPIYKTPWNPNRLGPSVDPRPFLTALAQGHAPNLTLTVTTAPGFLPLAQALDDAERFRPFDGTNPIGSVFANGSPVVARAIFVLLGLVLVIGVLQHLLRPVVERAQLAAAQAATLAAETGELAA